jgi:hypothetical protein
MNNAADAYALAGATQLDGLAALASATGIGACTRALQAIQAAVDADLANQETFGSNMPGPDVFISTTADPFNLTNNSNIRFLSDLVKDASGNVTGTYIANAADCDEDANHIEVTLDLADPNNQYQVDLMFAGITGAVTRAFPKGYAIAQYGTANCLTVPLMMCAIDEPGVLPGSYTKFIDALYDYELTGYGLYLKSGNNSTQWGSGNFGFLRIDGAGAKALGELIGGVNPEQDCLGTDELETEPGNNSGARRYFNTRFDVWQGLTGLMGESNYQPAPNAVKGWNRMGGACSFTGGGYSDPSVMYTGPGSYGGPEGSPPTAWNIDGVAADAAMPFPRDDCGYSGGGCEAVTNVGRLGNGNWDRATYMEVNHPLTAYSVWPGDQTMEPANATDWDIAWPIIGADLEWSRYETYLWELDRQHFSYPMHANPLLEDNPGGTGYEMLGSNPRIPDNTLGPVGPDPIPQINGEYAGRGDGSGNAYPQCFTGTMGNAGVKLRQDRRVVTAMVVDCDPLSPTGVEIKGKTTIPMSAILGTMDLFLLDTWQVNGGVHEISTEIIGPGGATGPTFNPVKKWVHLKEGRNALK